MAIPEGASAAKPVPGVVLIHGGGGTAFAPYAQQWLARGFACIAMDLEGHVPIRRTEPVARGESPWVQHQWSGPQRVGIWGDVNLPLREQWPYHTVVAISRAATLLLARPEVDAKRVGVTGFSWGGVFTIIAAGVDRRYAFAAPIYGSAFLWESMESPSGRADAAMTPANRKRARQWDSSEFIPHFRGPVHWIIGTNDTHSPLNLWNRSVALYAEPPWQTAKLGMAHGGRAAWEAVEPYAFAEMVVDPTRPRLTKIAPPILRGNALHATFQGQIPAAQELLYSTSDQKTWLDRKWLKAPATRADRELRADVPPGTRYAFFSVTNAPNLTFTSAMIDLTGAK